MLTLAQPPVRTATQTTGTAGPAGPQYQRRGQLFHIGEAQRLYDNFRSNNGNIGLWDADLPPPPGNGRQGPREPANDPHTPWTPRRGAIFSFTALNLASESDALYWLMSAPTGSYIAINVGARLLRPSFPEVEGFGVFLHNTGGNEVRMSGAHLIYELWRVYGNQQYIRGYQAGRGLIGPVGQRSDGYRSGWESMVRAEMLIKPS